MLSRTGAIAVCAISGWICGCTDPVQLDCGAGEAMRAGSTWVCVYPDAPTACPAEAPKRVDLPDGRFACASADATAATICAALDGCEATDGGARDTAATDSAVTDTGVADTGTGDTGTGDTGTADTGTADTGVGDAGAVGRSCATSADCDPGDLCEEWLGEFRCYRDCGVRVDGGWTGNSSLCVAAFGTRSSCVRWTVNKLRCSYPCDPLDRTACGAGHSCLYAGDYNGEKYTECRPNGPKAAGDSCPLGVHEACGANMICLDYTSTPYCRSYCDLGSGTGLDACPTGTHCTRLGGPPPGAFDSVGYCDPD